MVFGKKTLFSVLLGLEFLTNVLEFTHVNFFYTTTIISLCTSIVLPGFLLALVLRIKNLSFWENLTFIVGLGVAFLQFGGLLLNILLPFIGIEDPLAFQNLVFGFDFYMVLLFIFAWIRTKPLVIQLGEQPHLAMGSGAAAPVRQGQFVKPGFIDTHYGTLEQADEPVPILIQLPSRSYIEKVLYTLPIFFPVLATLGAIVLNNGGSDILTLILLAFIAFYSLLLVILRNKIAIDLYPYAIFFIGLAALFTTSLRSWYITGHDVAIEFYVFQLTNTHHVWNMVFFQDAYNACLSITILPTILTNLLSVQDIYVYKIIFQVIFALSPVLVFFIMKKYTTSVYAFLCAFFFVSFPTFFNDMPMLNRQEIGFIFFGLVLYVMLLSNLPLAMRKILFIIFALSVIVSHYSTNFILLILVAFVYTLTLIVSRSFVKNTLASLAKKSRITIKNTFPNHVFLNLPLVVLLFLSTYVWNTLYTHSSEYASSVVSEVVSSIFVTSSTDTRSGDLAYSIFFSPPKKDPRQELQDYINSIRQSEDLKKVNAANFYSQSLTSKYPSQAIPQAQLAPTPLGNLLTTLHIPVFDIQAVLRSISAYSLQIFVFIGLVALFFVKSKKPIDLQYLLLCFSALFVLGLITVLPAISADYGALRMFQQFLFLLSFPIVLGINTVLFFLKEQKRILVIGTIAIVFFLNLTGFISHLTGDYYPQLTLDNAGLYYDAYYVHTSDILAIAWLSKDRDRYDPVVADLPGINKLRVYGHIQEVGENFPSLIQKNAYVYLEASSNTVVSIDHYVLIYNSDKPFLDDNKNLIYSNGKNNIYK